MVKLRENWTYGALRINRLLKPRIKLSLFDLFNVMSLTKQSELLKCNEKLL